MATRTAGDPPEDPPLLRMSLEEFAALPEGPGYSLLDGFCCREPHPRVSHQEAAVRILALLERHADTHHDGIAPGSIDVYLDDRNVVAPDACFICNDRLASLDERGLHGIAPDLCVEILSPPTSARDRGVKADLYGRFGCREYWIVDLDGGVVTVLLPGSRGTLAPSGAHRSGDIIESVAVPVLRAAIRDVLTTWRTRASYEGA